MERTDMQQIPMLIDGGVDEGVKEINYPLEDGGRSLIDELAFW
jgi:hypothetical protein